MHGLGMGVGMHASAGRREKRGRRPESYFTCHIGVVVFVCFFLLYSSLFFFTPLSFPLLILLFWGIRITHE